MQNYTEGLLDVDGVAKPLSSTIGAFSRELQAPGMGNVPSQSLQSYLKIWRLCAVCLNI